MEANTSKKLFPNADRGCNSIANDLTISTLDHLFSEMELSLDAVRYLRNALTEPSELDRNELNSMAPLLGLYLLHVQQLIAAGRAIATPRAA